MELAKRQMVASLVLYALGGVTGYMIGQQATPLPVSQAAPNVEELRQRVAFWKDVAAEARVEADGRHRIMTMCAEDEVLVMGGDNDNEHDTCRHVEEL